MGDKKNINRFIFRSAAPLVTALRSNQWNRGYNDSLESDSLDPQQLSDYLDKRIVRVLKYAAKKIHFYKNLYQRAGVDIAKFSGKKDLHRLTTINKSDLLNAGNSIIRSSIPSFFKNTITTGGSTGTIATITSQRGFGNIEYGCTNALWNCAGFRRDDRIVRLRGTLLNGGKNISQIDRSRHRYL